MNGLLTEMTQGAVGVRHFFGRKLTDGSAYLSREGKRPGKWSRATCVAPR